MIQKTIKRVLDLPEWKIGLGIFLVALLLRIVYVIAAYYINPPWGDYSSGGNVFLPGHGDDSDYLSLTKQIVENGKMFYDVTDHSYSFIVGPGMPWFMSIIYLIFGENWLVFYLTTAFASSLIPLFVFKISILVFDKKTSLLAGIWSVFYFYYFWYASTAGKDIWMAFFYVFLLYALLDLFYKKKFTYPKFILFVFVFVYATHWDERFLIFIPLAFIFIFYSETLKSPFLNIKKTFLFLFLTMILMTPWTIRNYQETGKIVLISLRTQALTDKIFGYEPLPIMDSNMHDLYGTFYIKESQMDSVIAGLMRVTDGGWTITEQQRSFMEKGNLPREFSNFEAYWSRFNRLYRVVQIKDEWVRTGYEFRAKSFRFNVISALFYGPILLFSFFGFYLLYKNNRTMFWFFLLPIVLYTLVHVLMIQFTYVRYRLILDSVFIIVGCYGIIGAFDCLKHWRKPTLTHAK